MFKFTLKSTLSAAIILSSSILVMTSVSAQEKDTEEKTFLYASYFSCPGGKLSDVDKVVKNEFTPLYDAAVKDGTLKSWGWSTHHTGGRWQRIFSFGSDSVDNLLKSLDIMTERAEAANIDPDNIFGKVCTAHEDYIWELTAGSPGEPTGSAALSTYYQCDVSQEDRADEIVEKVFAPVYNANMGKGKLTSWAWAEHRYGGQYRRAVFTSAENYTDLLSSMDNVFNAVNSNNNSEGSEFTKICSNHSDYLWNRK